MFFFFAREGANRLWTALKVQHYNPFDMKGLKIWVHFSQFVEIRQQSHDKDKAVLLF